jgi:two-component system, cell cycle response regulator DivK
MTVATILYVEDNDDNVFMLRPRLERQGFRVLVATDGEGGLRLVREERPDLILMDLSLPGLDGWEATRRLKGDGATRAIPVIALSAHAMAGDRERALAAGCDDYDAKPVNLRRLLDKIRALLPKEGGP